ncbi:hypothetical protein ACH5RR_019109 [Cinchona calisaya]|uniref:Uncharacterized protein n=1 Tax=Cinchona calisaya TaxID=153742 RepID=A0ABD2ZRI3_9GENT
MKALSCIFVLMMIHQLVMMHAVTTKNADFVSYHEHEVDAAKINDNHHDYRKIPLISEKRAGGRIGPPPPKPNRPPPHGTRDCDKAGEGNRRSSACGLLRSVEFDSSDLEMTAFRYILVIMLVQAVALENIRNANKGYFVNAREIRVALSCFSKTARYEPSRLEPGRIIGWPSKPFLPLPNHEVHMAIPPSPCIGVISQPPPPPPPPNS